MRAVAVVVWSLEFGGLGFELQVTLGCCIADAVTTLVRSCSDDVKIGDGGAFGEGESKKGGDDAAEGGDHGS